MGENTEMTAVPQNQADRLQQEIRHTEADISQTVHAIEDRLSPTNIKRRAMARARQYLFRSMANAIDLVQRRPLQTALVGAGAVLMLVRKTKMRSRQRAATGMELAGTAARAFVAGAAGKAHKEAQHTGRNLIWKGLASALGAALGTTWYRRKPAPPPAEAGLGAEQPRAGAYPGVQSVPEPAGRY